MSLEDMILSAGSANALQNFAKQNGLSNDQLMSAVKALTPAIASGVRRQTSSQDGLQSLFNMMQSGNHEQFLDDGDKLGSSASLSAGNQILGQIFGSKDVSRGVAHYASQSSGISGTILKSLLPIIASMVMGSLTRKSSGSGMGDILGQILGGGGGSLGGSGGGMGDILGQVLGGGQAGGSSRGGSGGGMGDILGQILGGGQAGGSSGGGSPGLDDLLGGILGGGPVKKGVDPHSTDGGIFGDLLNPGNQGSQMDDLLSELSRRSQ